MKRPSTSRITHQLPEYARDGYPPSYEYPLPARIEPAILEHFDPWLQHLVTLSPAEAHISLARRLTGLRDEALVRLRDYLLECTAQSIVVTASRAWLLCLHENGGLNLVGPPIDSSVISQRRLQWHLEGEPLLAQFVAHFAGMREDFAPGGGSFIDEQAWEGVTEPWMKQIEGSSRWQGSLIIFSSRGGDKLLLHRSGRVGWWVADEVRMRDAYENLASCLLDFVRYRAGAWPFDPYEPRADHFRVIG